MQVGGRASAPHGAVGLGTSYVAIPALNFLFRNHRHPPLYLPTCPTHAAVSARVDSKLEAADAAAAERLAAAAAQLQAGLEESCHGAHLELDKKMAEAAGACHAGWLASCAGKGLARLHGVQLWR